MHIENSMTVSEAVKLAESHCPGITGQTLRNWCRTYDGLGRKVGGRWFISPTELSALLHGDRA